METNVIDLLENREGVWTLRSESAFTTTAAPNTLFLLPKNRKPAEIMVQRFSSFAEIEKKWIGGKPVPVDKMAYIRCNSNSFILLHDRSVNRLYLAPTAYGVAMAVTNGGVYISNGMIYFPQKAGAAPCTPDTSGYSREADGGIAYPKGVARYTSGNTQYISKADADCYIAKYSELKAKYAEEPESQDGKHIVDEKIWERYQTSAGYMRMEYADLLATEIYPFLESTYDLQRNDLCKDFEYGGKRYVFIPEEWRTIEGILSDPRAIAAIPRVRRVAQAVAAMTSAQMESLKKGLLATV
mgnify:CR=1 FL=1